MKETNLDYFEELETIDFSAIPLSDQEQSLLHADDEFAEKAQIPASAGSLVLGASDCRPAGGHVEAQGPELASEVQMPAKGIFGLRRLLAAVRLVRRGSETSGQTAASLMEARGYAKEAPRFQDIATDETRVNMFIYHEHRSEAAGKTSEHNGLAELTEFLTRYNTPVAKSMLENLTFIGEKEYAEGAAGLASYWKQFLDSDPEAQICVFTKISQTHDSVKSDKHLLERILKHFTDKELKHYSGRLVMDPKLLKSDPEKVRSVLLDDWIISGSQMSDAIYRASLALGVKYMDTIEINLLTASSKRLAGFHKGLRRLHVRSYFLAHDANGPVKYEDNGAYISGTHSSVDYEFFHPISKMLGDTYGSETLPRLARIIRNYDPNCPQAARLRQVNSKLLERVTK